MANKTITLKEHQDKVFELTCLIFKESTGTVNIFETADTAKEIVDKIYGEPITPEEEILETAQKLF